MQAKALFKFWKLSKTDGVIWIVTLLSVVLIGIDVGLLIGILTSLASIWMHSIKSYTCLLGHIPNTDLYLDQSRYQGVSFSQILLNFLLNTSSSNPISITSHSRLRKFEEQKLFITAGV